MVNKVVLEYLRLHRGNFKIGDLKKKVLASGYSQKDIDEAVAVLNKEGVKKVPEVGATIDKINKTNIDVNEHKPVQQKVDVAGSVAEVKPVEVKEIVSSSSGSSKKMKILKWLLIIFMIIFILGVVGFSVWMFFLK